MKTAPDAPIPVLLTTPRLFLRELQEEDGTDISAYLSLPAMRQFILPSQCTTENTHQFVKTAVLHAGMKPRSYYALGIVLQGQEQLIGTCSLSSAFSGSTAQIGWDLNPVYWGKGYMTEAATSLVNFAFGHCGVQCLFSDGFATNKASIRVMEKLGMQRQSLRLRDEARLALYYRVMRRLVRYIRLRD